MRILMIGCGTMGSSLLKVWLETKTIGQAITISPSVSTIFAGDERVKSYRRLQDMKDFTAIKDGDKSHSPAFDCIIYAAKPHHVQDILPAYAVFKHCLFMSIAAGIEVSCLQKLLGKDTPIVRVMPNIASSFGQGVSIFYAPQPPIVRHHEITIKDLLSPTGVYGKVDNENHLAVVTALSGCGTAYVFCFMQAMVQAATKCTRRNFLEKGLTQKEITSWVIQTVLGASFMARNSDKSLEQLIRDVCSPQGITEQAIRVLMAEDGLASLMEKTIETAVSHTKKLQKSGQQKSR